MNHTKTFANALTYIRGGKRDFVNQQFSEVFHIGPNGHCGYESEFPETKQRLLAQVDDDPGMTFQQFLSVLPMCLASAMAWMGLLFGVLLFSERPNFWIEVSCIPLLGVAVALTVISNRRLKKLVGQEAVVTGPMIIFLCCIPAFVIVESTLTAILHRN